MHQHLYDLNHYNFKDINILYRHSLNPFSPARVSA